MQVSNLCSYAIDPRKFAPNCFVSIKLKIVLQNNFLPILHPEELACAKLSTQAKDYSGLENDRGNYFVTVKEMNRSLTPVNCFFSLNLELQLQDQYHYRLPPTEQNCGCPKSRTLFWEHRSSHFFIFPISE
jgi:hypothetical protein